jgi:hypothetical protein
LLCCCFPQAPKPARLLQRYEWVSPDCRRRHAVPVAEAAADVGSAVVRYSCSVTSERRQAIVSSFKFSCCAVFRRGLATAAGPAKLRQQAAGSRQHAEPCVFVRASCSLRSAARCVDRNYLSRWLAHSAGLCLCIYVLCVDYGCGCLYVCVCCVGACVSLSHVCRCVERSLCLSVTRSLGSLQTSLSVLCNSLSIYVHVCVLVCVCLASLASPAGHTH